MTSARVRRRPGVLDVGLTLRRRADPELHYSKTPALIEGARTLVPLVRVQRQAGRSQLPGPIDERGADAPPLAIGLHVELLDLIGAEREEFNDLIVLEGS